MVVSKETLLVRTTKIQFLNAFSPGDPRSKKKAQILQISF